MLPLIGLGVFTGFLLVAGQTAEPIGPGLRVAGIVLSLSFVLIGGAAFWPLLVREKVTVANGRLVVERRRFHLLPKKETFQKDEIAGVDAEWSDFGNLRLELSSGEFVRIATGLPRAKVERWLADLQSLLDLLEPSRVPRADTES